MDENTKDPKALGGVSRRDFLRYGGVGAAGLAASSILAQGVAQDAAEGAENATRPTIPDAFEAQRAAVLSDVEWPLSGAQVFAKLAKEEELGALFCCPGNYDIVHSIAEEGIPTIGGRDERSTAHAADAFTRTTGVVSACSGTEGPGFTNMITGVAAANGARTPLLVLASNMSKTYDDTEATLQTSNQYQQPTTEGMKKYGKRITDPERVWEYAGYAWRHLKSGEPRPVHLDFVSEVSRATFEGPGDLVRSWNKGRYRTDYQPHPDPAAVQAAVDLLERAERPIVVASTGAFYNMAGEAIRMLAEKADIAVVQSGSSYGHFPSDHRLSVDAAPDALYSADVVVYVGQYNMPPAGIPGGFAFSPDAQVIQIEPDPTKIGRNQPADVGIVSNERLAIEAIADAIRPGTRAAWVDEIAAARQAFLDENLGYYEQYRNFSGAVHQSVIAKELSDFLYEGDIPKEQTTVLSGGYSVARYARRFLKAFRPGQVVNGAYHYAAIGPDIAFALGVGLAVKEGIGAQAAVKGAPVVSLTGDGGVAFSIMEIETQAKHKMPVINIVYNNNAWGTWTGQAENPVTLPIHLFQENLRYDRVAEALGAHGEYVTEPGDFTPALRRAYEVAVNENRPSIINCQGIKEFHDAGQYAPGFLGKVEPGAMAYYH